MQAMVCELCGSNDFLKQDGMYVCQHCHTKYSPEEAKKLLGTVKIDESDKIKNYHTMAENAYSSGNNKEAESYCNKIIEIEPDNSEAWLLKGIASAWQSTLARDRTEELITCSENAFKNAKTVDELNDLGERAFREYYRLTLAFNKLWIDHVVSFPDTWKEYIQFPVSYLMNEIKIQVAYGEKFNAFYKDKPDDEKVKPNNLPKVTGLEDLDIRCKSELIDGGIKLWNSSLNEFNKSNDGHPTDYDFDNMSKDGFVAKSMLDYAIPSDTSKIRDEQKPNVIKACKNLITMETVWIDLKSYEVDFSGGFENYHVSKQWKFEAKQESTAKIRKYHETIKLCDPSYEIPVVAEPKAKGCCVVATAVYGSYDCPQVWTLRRYRDDILAKTWYGRTFIHTYYAIGPTIVKWFGDTDWFKNMWKPKLDRMVCNLNAEGVEDTPYEDKIW